MSIVDWIFIILYFAVLVLIGYQTSKRINTVEDYNIAGGKVIWPAMFATLAASFLGGGSSIGLAGNVLQNGYVYMFAFFGFAIQFLLIGYFIAPKLKRYKGAQTVADIMERHYGKTAKLFTGILSIALCIGILGAQAVAIGAIFNVTLGMTTFTGILIGMGVVILYSTVGGLWAVIQTDVVQFIILGILLPVVLIIGLFHVGGVEGLIASVPDTHFSIMGDWTMGAFISLLITFLLGEALVPPYAQRAFASKDPSHARKGYVVSGFFAFGFFFITGTIGLIGYQLFPNVAPDTLLPTIVSELLPIGVTGLAVAALLAVIMSTASSYLNATSVSFIQDIYVPFIKKDASEKSLLLIGKVVTLLTGVGAVGFALAVPNIIDALSAAYTIWAPTIVLPLIIAVVFKVYHKAAGVSSIITGGVFTAIWTWFLDEPFGFTGIVPGLIGNILAFVVVYAIMRNKSGHDMEIEPETKTAN
ncbi:sodium:solute symporter family protein [Oceanobacillus picturae]|uniref:sodium:solute symporter family protein n=1 Tax=Oceanobacillus picturae TaxID=171693 RepID=UPI00363631A7